MRELCEELSLRDVMAIFSAHLNCPDSNGCDNCILNENKIEGHRVGCLKLRDMAMQRIVDMFGNR